MTLNKIFEYFSCISILVGNTCMLNALLTVLPRQNAEGIMLLACTKLFWRPFWIPQSLPKGESLKISFQLFHTIINCLKQKYSYYGKRSSHWTISKKDHQKWRLLWGLRHVLGSLQGPQIRSPEDNNHHQGSASKLEGLGPGHPETTETVTTNNLIISVSLSSLPALNTRDQKEIFLSLKPDTDMRISQVKRIKSNCYIFPLT